MTSPARLLPVTVGLLLLTAPAFAQAPGQLRFVEQPTGLAGQAGSVRVQSSVNLFMPGPSGDGEEAQKLRDRARRVVYEMAARECDLLRDAIARDCRLESINVNLGRQYGGQQQEGFNVNGSMSLQITLK
ncbi:hypothetical protein [Bradyrhizobium septentrionale]|uniref:UrcA family protein n=1 Tax=Bradyrhizobium septentrionale TaxID=1404411 RepID=A0A973W4S5_9BRAD|nr:hypothetical protein [Bradyrhizobium septentrionale]UGY15830.1 hypothetical protein HAP48_0046305 [Bradyrhizobium septentrionale]UGY24404.1 hypothetical protein HU675_0041940 [Bradyrhizobium septentrionale]